MPVINQSVMTVSIANGQSVSSSQYLGSTISGVILPASWDAADLTVQVSLDNTNWFNLYQRDGTEYLIKAAVSRCALIDPVDMGAVPYIRFRSGTSGVPVNQTALRTLTIIGFAAS